MGRAAEGFLFWVPRILCILYCVFLSLFSLDVFSANAGFLEKMLGLLIHLVPVFVVAGALALAWRRELAGAVLFTAMAVSYPVAARGDVYWAGLLTLSGPLLVIAALFLAGWLRGRRPSPAVA
jgi:hypothetical protein